MLLLVLTGALSRVSLLPGELPASRREPEGYDFTRSTSDNHEAKGARLRREFFTSRVGLDYGFHTRYSLERQALQDEIIRSMLSFEDMRRIPS